MKRRVLGLMGAFLLLPAVAFAVPVAITWEWTLDDPDVSTFRYQLDGEDPDGWTVVDASQTSYTAENMDGTKSYTLYLQQSYDGEHFSASATSTSEPLEAEKPVPAEPVVAETPAVVGQPAEAAPASIEQPAEAAPVEAPQEEPKAVEEHPVEPAGPVVVETPTVAEQPVKAEGPEKGKAPKSRAPFRFGFGPYAGIQYVVDQDDHKVFTSTHAWLPSLGGEIKMENIFAGKVVGLGLDLKGAWSLDTNSKWKKVWKDSTDWYNMMDGSAALELDFNIGKGLLTLGAGGFGTYRFDGEDWAYGVLGSVGLGYHFTKHLYMGVDGQYRYYLYNCKDTQTIGATASMLFTF